MLDADKLLLARRNAKLTQAQLAARLGVSRRTLLNWEGGRYALPADLDERLIAALAEPNSAPAGAINPVGRPPKRPAWMPNFPSAVWDTYDPWDSWADVRLWFYFQAARRFMERYEEPTATTMRVEVKAHLDKISNSNYSSGSHRFDAWQAEIQEYLAQEERFEAARAGLVAWLKTNGLEQ